MPEETSNQTTPPASPAGGSDSGNRFDPKQIAAGAMSQLERQKEGLEGSFYNLDAGELEKARQQDLQQARENQGEPGPPKKSPEQPPKNTEKQPPDQDGENVGEPKESESESEEPEEPSNPLEIPPPKDKRKNKDWQTLKAHYQKQIDDLKAQLTNGADPKIIEERDKYKKLVQEIAIEKDPEFASKFDNQKNAAVRAAKTAAGDQGEQLGKLLDSPPSASRDQQIDSLVENLPQSSQRRINAALTKIDQIEFDRQSEIETRKTHYDASQSQIFQGQQEQQKARQADLKKAYQQALQQWTDPENGMELMVKKNDDDQFNQQVDQTIKLAENIFSGQLDDKDIANAALWAANGSRMYKTIQSQQQEISNLKSQLNKYRGSQPSDSDYQPKSSQGKKSPKSVYDPDYVQEFASDLEAARRADFQKAAW